MEIATEDIGVLNKLIKFKIQPEDYKPKFEAELKEYQKKSRIDGFRPGHVPLGLIKQRFGKGLLYDAINKLIPEHLQNYIEENKLSIIGTPIPSKTDTSLDDVLNSEAEMEFHFELGLEPEINLDQSFDEVIIRYLLDPSEDMVDEEIKNITRNFGTHSQPDVSEEGDILYGQFIELDENGNEKENGLSAFTALAIDLIPNPDNRKQFIGLKKDDEVTFDIFKTIENEGEIARILNTKKEAIPDLSPNFKFKISSANRVIKAEINQEFFDKLFGPDTVKSEEEFRVRVKQAITNKFTEYSDEKLFKDIQEYLMKKLNPILPNEFIKRLLVFEYPDKYTVEELETDYQKIEETYQWNFIEKAVMRKNNIHVHKDELEHVAANYLHRMYSEQGINLDDEQLDKFTKKFLENKKESDKMYENIIEHKIFESLRELIKTEDKSLPMDEFTEVFKK